MTDTRSAVHVVAGIVRDGAGCILLARRAPGKHLAGLWEFPGGKRECGESSLDTLTRELHEELGIRVESAQPLICVPWNYPEKRVLLDVWEVVAYSGMPTSREGQALAWIDQPMLDDVSMPAADRPVITALRLPRQYLITPPLDDGRSDAVLKGLQAALATGIRLIQLRLPGWPRERLAVMARAARDLAREHDARLLLNADWQLAVTLGLAGAHLPARIAAGMASRPRGLEWLAVSCHDETELAVALRLDADFVTLSPIRPTPDHVGAHPLGWSGLAGLSANFPLPIYALGGVGIADLESARQAGAHGIAAIRGLWPA
ncbi:MAG: Nudix family hydrolase [Rhodanobacteraceae bacterium]